MPNNNEDPQSWDEMVKSVEAQKRHTSIMDHKDYQSAVTKNVIRSQLNPVQMKFIDENKEKEYMTMRLKREMDKCAKDLEKKSSHFDPINHQGPPRKPIPSKTNTNGRIDRNWRLLSLVPEDEHKSLSIFYDESIPERQKQFNSTMSVPIVDNSALRRPYNILSNAYVKNDDQVTQQESQLLKEHIKDKFWQTHNYDPIHSEYFDVNKDKEMKEKDLNSIRSKEYRKVEALPKSFLCSEGKNYDIINQESYRSKNELIKPNMSAVKSEFTMKRLKQVEELVNDQKYRGDMSFTIKENRGIQRISHARWTTQLDREYNIVNNAQKSSRTSSYQPHVPRPEGVWDKVNNNTTNNNNLNTNSYSYSYSPYTPINNTSSRSQNMFSPAPSSRSLGPQTSDRSYIPTERSARTDRSETGRIQTDRPYDNQKFIPKLSLLNSTANF